MGSDKSLINVDIESPFSVKAEIKTEIPKESTGRLLDALTDAIRPFTERRGLRADLLRLQAICWQIIFPKKSLGTLFLQSWIL